jgi:hypothetical protein
MEVFSMVDELEKLKVFSTDDLSIASKMNAMIKSHVKEFKLTELMRFKDDNSSVKIYVKAGENKEYVSEVLMIIKDINKKSKENVGAKIVSLTGNIDINKISKLADTYSKKSKKI